MTAYSADAHAHVQRLVSVDKMATVLEECNTEDQRRVERFMWVQLYHCFSSSSQEYAFYFVSD
jgi:hypothetical protein